MEKSSRLDLIENAIQQTGEAANIVGLVVAPVGKRIAETGVLFLGREIHRARRKYLTK